MLRGEGVLYYFRVLEEVEPVGSVTDSGFYLGCFYIDAEGIKDMCQQFLLAKAYDEDSYIYYLANLKGGTVKAPPAFCILYQAVYSDYDFSGEKVIETTKELVKGLMGKLRCLTRPISRIEGFFSNHTIEDLTKKGLYFYWGGYSLRPSIKAVLEERSQIIFSGLYDSDIERPLIIDIIRV